MRLPGEIRNIIYDKAFLPAADIVVLNIYYMYSYLNRSHDPQDDPKHSPWRSFRDTCRAVRIEMLSKFYQHAIF